MDDAIDDAMAMDEDELGEEEQVDEILSKVLDEIGVDLNTTLKDTPTGINAGNIEQADGQEWLKLWVQMVPVLMMLMKTIYKRD